MQVATKLQKLSADVVRRLVAGQLCTITLRSPQAEDARAAMDLYKLARPEWEKSLAYSGQKRRRRAIVNQQAR